MKKTKVVFVSNVMSHHQAPISQEMNKIWDYTFIATKMIAESENIRLGEDENKKFDFIIRSYESDESYNEALKKIDEADIVIYGSCPFEMIKKRIEANKITFRYSERLFKDKTLLRKFHPKLWKRYYSQCSKYKHNRYYLLCASAFAARDYAWYGAFKNKCYKWGYFPPLETIDVDKVLQEREQNKKLKIVWCNRIIKYKHPEMAIVAARHLKSRGINFEIQMFGTGNLSSKIERMIKKYDLENEVHFNGLVLSGIVRKTLKEADIALLTADKGEGWGAGVNEAMNSCCAVLCNKYTGSVPYLVQDNVNGMIYKNKKEFLKKLDMLVESRDFRNSLGKKAYEDLQNKWSPEIAARRFEKLAIAMLNNEKCDFKDGPCSPAK